MTVCYRLAPRGPPCTAGLETFLSAVHSSKTRKCDNKFTNFHGNKNKHREKVRDTNKMFFFRYPEVNPAVSGTEHESRIGLGNQYSVHVCSMMWTGKHFCGADHTRAKHSCFTWVTEDTNRSHADEVCAPLSFTEHKRKWNQNTTLHMILHSTFLFNFFFSFVRELYFKTNTR